MGYWFVAMVFLWGGVGGLPLSAKAARFGLCFARGGVVVVGRIVDVERSHRTVPDSDGTETIVSIRLRWSPSTPPTAGKCGSRRSSRERAR